MSMPRIITDYDVIQYEILDRTSAALDHFSIHALRDPSNLT